MIGSILDGTKLLADNVFPRWTAFNFVLSNKKHKVKVINEFQINGSLSIGGSVVTVPLRHSS